MVGVFGTNKFEFGPIKIVCSEDNICCIDDDTDDAIVVCVDCNP